MKRSDFDKARALAQAGGFKLLMVGRVDRFGRDEAQFWLYIWEFIQVGVCVYFCDEDIAAGLEEGWQDRLSSRIGDAAAVSRTIGRNVAKSVRTRRKRNLHVGLMPFGWRRIDGAPAADPTDIAVVRAAFSLAAQDQLKVASIADQLNAVGMRFRAGRMLTKSNVYEMLTNPFHKGTWRITDAGQQIELPDRHQGVISPADFAVVQRLLAERGRSRRSPERPRASHAHIFRGLLYCGDATASGEVCGARIAARGGREAGKYLIYSHAEGKGCCESGSGLLWCVSEGVLRRQMDELFSQARLPEEAIAVIAQYNRELSSGVRPDVDALREGYERRLRRLDDLYKAGSYDHAPDPMQAWKAERAVVIEQLRALPQPTPLPDPDKTAEVRTLAERWHRASADYRHRILTTLFAKIYVTRRGGAERTSDGRLRQRGTQRIAWLEPHPECELLVAYMFSAQKEEAPRTVPLPELKGRASAFSSWLKLRRAA